MRARRVLRADEFARSRSVLLTSSSATKALVAVPGRERRCPDTPTGRCRGATKNAPQGCHRGTHAFESALPTRVVPRFPRIDSRLTAKGLMQSGRLLCKRASPATCSIPTLREGPKRSGNTRCAAKPSTSGAAGAQLSLRGSEERVESGSSARSRALDRGCLCCRVRCASSTLAVT